MFRMPDERLPKKLLFGQVKARGPRAALGLVSLMLQCMSFICTA